ncbi:ParE family toxin-like protein [Pseudoalteromonas xiamenensis]
MSTKQYVFPLTEQSAQANTISPLMCGINARVWQYLSFNQQVQTVSLINEIASGKPYPLLGGRKVKCNSSLVRFRIGRNHRLILNRTPTNFFFQLVSRQNYERNFNKKFGSLTVKC